MGQEEIGPGASASTEKFAPVSKINRLIDSHSPPPVINTQDSLGVIRMEAWVGTTGYLQSRLSCESDPWGLHLRGQSLPHYGPLQTRHEAVDGLDA